MYTNYENNMTYPDMANDYNEDINCEKLFDQCYEIYNKYIEATETKKGLKRIQTVETTNYERNNFISFIENHPDFLNKNGYVSSAKIIGYAANILVKCFHPNSTNLSKSRMQKEFNAAVKIITVNCKNKNHISDSRSVEPSNNYPNEYSSPNNYQNRYYSGKANSNNVTLTNRNNPSGEDKKLKFRPIVKGNFVDDRNIVHNNRKDKETNNPDVDKNDVKKPKSYNSHSDNRNSHYKRKNKRKIKGVNRAKNLLYRGIAISALVASLTVGGINHSIANRNLINNTTYQTAQSNSISPAMYLSNKGDQNNLLHSPMFGSDGFKESNMFSDKNKFDVSLLKLYEEYGNYGISKYISQKIDSGDMLSINDMKNLSKANKVFSLSVMQDELINSLGNKKNDKVKYADVSIAKIDPDGLYSEGDHIVLFYDQYGYHVDKTYYADKYISQYIKDSENYFSQIDEKFDDIDKKIEKNQNYDKSVDCYRNLIDINDLVSKSFSETNTFAARNHQKRFSIPENKIVTRGVNLNSKEEVDKMKIDLNHNNDERDGR